VAPVRQSIVGAGGSAAVRPSEEVMRRQVVVKESPAAPRVSYERQQQVLSAQPGRVPTPQQMTNCADHKRDNKHPLGNLLRLTGEIRTHRNPSASRHSSK